MVQVGKITRFRWLRDIHTSGFALGVYIPKPPQPPDLTYRPYSTDVTDDVFTSGRHFEWQKRDT